MFTEYIEQKRLAYQAMNITRKKAGCPATLSEIYDASLTLIQRYAVSLDTFDYMYLESGCFAAWYGSEYARITLQSLETLFGEVVISSEIATHQVHTVRRVERAIDSSIAILKAINCEGDDLLAIDLLQKNNSQYRSLRSKFMGIMSQWFETQV